MTLKHFPVSLLLIIGVAAVTAGVCGLLERSFALQLDYETGAGADDCSPLIVAYGVALCLSVILGLAGSLAERVVLLLSAFYILAGCVIILFAVMAAFVWFVEYGHVAALDAQFRDHDTASRCWTGIEERLTDRNSIVVDERDDNCYVKEFKTFCATCRKVYRRDEPTLFKKHRLTIFLTLALIVGCHATHLLQLFFKIYYRRGDSQTTTEESVYSSPKNPAVPVTPSFWRNTSPHYFSMENIPPPPPPPTTWATTTV